MRTIFAAAAYGLAFVAAAAAAPLARPGPKPEMILQMGHTSTPKSIDISPDGKYLLTGNVDETAKLWDLETGAELRTFRGHKNAVYAAFSPNGRFIATASHDHTARLWDAAAGKTIRTFRGHTNLLTSLAFTADGKFLVTGSGDKTAKLWDLSTGRALRTFIGHAKSVDSVALSRDGRFLVTGAEDGARLWNAETGAAIRTFTEKNVSAVAVSADGKRVAGVYGTAAALWDLATGKEVLTFDAPDLYGTYAMALSRDGKTMATGHNYKSVQLWDLATGARIRNFKGTLVNPSGGGSINSMALSPDGKSLAANCTDGTATLWDLATGAEIRSFNRRGDAIKALALSPDGKYLAAAGRNSPEPVVWDLSAGERLPPFKGHWGSVNSVAFTPDSKSFVTGGYDNTARLWEISSGRELRRFNGHAGQVGRVAVSPDGGRLVTGSADHTAKLWDLSNGAELRSFAGMSTMGSIAFTPDGKSLATASVDVHLWSLDTGDKIRSYPSAITDLLAMHPDGRSIVTVDSGIATQRDIVSGLALKAMSSDCAVLAIAFTPGGRMLATGAYGGARLWDMATGAVIRTLTGHTGNVWAIAASPDGKRLVTGGDDGTTRIWDLASGRELCRLISVGAGWVVVTPDGYFDGSADGLKSIRWTVGLQSFPLEAFSEGYYIPGLLARLMSGEKIAVSKSLAKGFALPPLVKITAPADGTSARSDALEVTVSAADQGGGVDEIRLYQNGKALDDETRGMKAVGRARTFRVTLVDGENVFKAVALSRDRIESNPDQIKILYGGPEKRSRLHLLVVGVNQYKNADLNLNYAQPDAKSIADFFGSGPDTLFAGTTKALLFDAGATKSAILAEFAALKNTPPQDVVVVYFAGHGESIGNSWYFVPYDLVYPEQEEEVKAKGLSSEELKDAIRGMGAQKVLLMMDACKSGGALAAFAGRGVEDRKALSMLARAAGVHVVAASTKDQIAAEVAQLGHGVFTYTLLRGLAGGAARNGVVTVGSLLSYIQSELPDISQKYRAQAQYPVVDSRGMDFPLTTGK